MEVTKSPEDEYRHCLVFCGEEIEAVGAAYREHIYYAALKGNSGSIGKYEVSVAENWGPDKPGQRTVYVNNPEHGVTDVLEDFYERTDEAITQMPGEANVSPFLNFDIPHRFHLGKVAIRLVEEIREKTTVSDFISDLDNGPEAIIGEGD